LKLLWVAAVARYARAQERSPVSFGPTDLVCCRTLQGHTGKVITTILVLLNLILICFHRRYKIEAINGVLGFDLTGEGSHVVFGSCNY
jgi:hypothetical protein